MKFKTHKEFEDYYTEGAKWLEEDGVYNWYYNDSENKIIAVPDFVSDWENLAVKEYYGEQAKKLRDVLLKYWHGELNDDDFLKALETIEKEA